MRDAGQGSENHRVSTRLTLSVALVMALALVVAPFPALSLTGDERSSLVLFDRAEGKWHLRYSDGSLGSFFFGAANEVPLMGDWDCDGEATVATYDPSTGRVSLRNSNTPGEPALELSYGERNVVLLAGDWNGDGCDTLAVYRTDQGRVRGSNTLGTATNFEFFFGVPGDRPFVGDFNGDGVDGVGVRRDTTGRVYLRNDLSTGVADLDFHYGVPGDRVIVGDWDQDGLDTVSVFRPPDRSFYLSNENSTRAADTIIQFGNEDWAPVSGAGRLEPQAVSNSVLWEAGHETGDFSEWARISISGDADAVVTDRVVRSGRLANALTIYGADGGSSSPGVRMAVEEVEPVPDHDPENLPTEAFYSVYYSFPQVVDSTWWNVYQWKQAYLRGDGSQTRHPVYTVNPELRSDGSMYLKLRSKVDESGQYTTPGSTLAESAHPLPIGSWVHLECFYRWSQTPDGRIACWQDGLLLWDIDGIVTEFDLPFNTHPRQWTVNNYANDTSPSTHTIYIDDAAISSSRLGPTP